MAWLAVNKRSKEEILFYNKPIRINYEKIFRDETAYYTIDSKLMDPFYEIYGNLYCGIELPKGSIKKLIGKELTWEDEPVEI